LKPDAIICDEVFSGLSMSEISSLLPLLERLQMEGITIMMIEHRLRELFRLTDRVMVMNFGQKIAEGVPKEVIENPEVRKAYLGRERTR
jgi:branched-chain amino acid transport system ATP-binding protein